MPRVRMSASAVAVISQNALAYGPEVARQRSAICTEINYARWCQKPIGLEIEGRHMTASRQRGGYRMDDLLDEPVLRLGRKYQTGPKLNLHALMEVPCRKCPGCLRERARHWRNRAMREIEAAPRTWFVTLTLRPEQHNLMRYRAAAKATVVPETGEVLTYEQLPPIQQSLLEHRQIAREITLYLKRVRKASATKFRYVCVLEWHEGGGANHGLPHYHLLVHETTAGGVLYRDLLGDRSSPRWPHGVTHAKLVDLNATSVRESAWYVAKYLSKSAHARVRASKRYGEMPTISQGS